MLRSTGFGQASVRRTAAGRHSRQQRSTAAAAARSDTTDSLLGFDLNALIQESSKPKAAAEPVQAAPEVLQSPKLPDVRSFVAEKAPAMPAPEASSSSSSSVFASRGGSSAANTATSAPTATPSRTMPSMDDLKAEMDRTTADKAADKAAGEGFQFRNPFASYPEPPVTGPPEPEPKISPPSLQTPPQPDAVPQSAFSTPSEPLTPPSGADAYVPAETPKPDTELPDSELPDFELPKFEVPKFELPKFTMPERVSAPVEKAAEKAVEKVPEAAALPSAAASAVQPQAPVDTPSAAADVMQNAADAPAPKFEMPKFELPKFEMPAKAPAPPSAPSAPSAAPPVDASIAAVDAVQSGAADAPVPELPDFVTSGGSRLSLDDLKGVGQSMRSAASPSDATKGVSDAFDGAGSSVTGALDSAGASVNSALDNASGALSGAQASAAAALDSFLGGINRESAAQQAAVAEKINNFLPKESLVPPAAQEQLSAVGAAFASAQDSFNEAPIGYTVLFSLSVALPAYLIQRSVYGGYCGSLSVADLFATLTSEPNVRVIDVRAQIELEDSGVLDLRREARGKGVALAFVQVERNVQAKLRDVSTVNTQITAALICGLVGINSETKLVVMDSRDSQRAKTLARTITEQGYQGYLLKGGFAAWNAAGLGVKEGTSYAVSAGDKLSDQREDLAEAAQQTLDEVSTTLSRPVNAAGATALAILTLVALAKPHEALQSLGFIGIQLTLLTYVLQFDNPNEAFSQLSGKVTSAANSVASVAKSVPLPKAPISVGKAATSKARPAEAPGPQSQKEPSQKEAPSEQASDSNLQGSER